ncbi:Helicase-like transcription factor [Lasiodiplodia hormozganensis]|uniref:Helicase-like transcription factor n=1 Tax=Lasiodiplodia hormozganensis TaxID=869390 RepID=A0AA40D2D6_9PEZI|nr:Helicase-like transcription factor [Lasiodiplodia hormozganensis]
MAGPSRKRAIDLDDDVQITGSQTRKNPRLTDVPIGRGPDDDEWDESALEEVVDPSQEYNDRAFIQYMLYGTLSTKIVGVRYYNGYATIGEMVMLRREPHNPYDGNAIQVLNVQAQQIGHIPRQIAAKLARYMDNRSLIVEGVITGHKGTFDMPLAVKLYGTSDPVERLSLTSEMKADRLPLDEFRRIEKAERDRLKAAQQAAKKQKSAARQGKSDQQWAAGVAPGSSQADEQSLDDIVGESERFNPRNVDQMVEKFGAQEADLQNLPMAKQPKEISAELLPYQLQGLQWLLDHENPQLPAAGSADVVQLWRRAPHQANVFTNICTNYSIKDKLPELASGGILADDMGLGKTVQIISLIVADRALKGQDQTSNATLILAPLSVMSNWSSQIKRHVKPEHELRVLTYHGTRKRPIDPKTIKDYDVVVTTYETVMTEFWAKQGKSSQNVPRKDGLFSVHWRRIVLDEGHNIRNPASKKAVAATNLLARSRWVLTGTPIINTLKDLYSLAKFIRLSGGLDRFELFNGALIRPVNQGDEHGSFLLQILMSSICLRRRKDMPFIDLRLPELSEYVHRIKFLPHEQEKYDALEAQAKGTLDQYRQKLSGNDAAKTYRHLLEILLRLRQVCNHWKLCGEERITGLMELLSEQKSVDLTPENCAALQAMLQLSIDSQEDCPICLEPLHDAVITCCAHAFGYSCIERVIEGQRKCPMCRAELPSTGSLVHPPKEAPAPPPIDADTNSSKIEALLKILKATASKDKGIKTIVFSQWTSFLDVLEPQLQAAGVRFARIDGTMSALARDASLEALDTDPDCTVLLASLAVCSVGLNLVAASQVILADSWWAPAIEDQAVDRVHRLGQKRETTVFRLVVEGTVEENVLRIQEDKRKLMRLAFSEKSKEKKKDRGARVADLERLLGAGSG